MRNEITTVYHMPSTTPSTIHILPSFNPQNNPMRYPLPSVQLWKQTQGC